MRLRQRWEGSPRRVRVGLLVLVALGLAMRLFEVWRFNIGHPADATALVGDEPGYDNLALALVRGTGFFDWPGRVPLYSTFLGGLHLLTNQSYDAIRYIQAVLGVTTVPLTYLLARRVFPATRGPALIAAFLAATGYALIEHAPRLQSEALYAPVVLVAFITVWDSVSEPTTSRSLRAGFAVGLTALIRPALLFFPAALFATLVLAAGWRPAVRGTAAFAGSMAATLLPWIIFTYLKFGALLPLQTSGAILWQGSPEYFDLVRHQGYSYDRVWTEVIYGPGWQAHDPTSVAGDRWWTDRAVQSIKTDPGTYLRYAVEKLGTFWVGDANADWANSHVFNFAEMSKYFSPRKLFMIATSRGLPLVAFLACLVLGRQWRRLLPLYAVLGYVTLLHAATHAEFRLSSPFQPILMVLIGGAAVVWWNRRRPAEPTLSTS